MSNDQAFKLEVCPCQGFAVSFNIQGMCVESNYSSNDSDGFSGLKASRLTLGLGRASNEPKPMILHDEFLSLRHGPMSSKGKDQHTDLEAEASHKDPLPLATRITLNWTLTSVLGGVLLTWHSL